MAPVSSTLAQYKDVSTAPASWNTTGYYTDKFSVILLNTSLAAFDAPTQTAVLNAVNNYLIAEHYSNFYMGLDHIYGYSVGPNTNTLVACCSHLRQQDAVCLQTVCKQTCNDIKCSSD